MFTPLVIALLPLLASSLPLSTCSSSSATDPCLPGGKWDLIQAVCVGYDFRGCFGCYTGPTCDTLDAACTLVLEGGQPAVFQEYWESVNGEPCTATGADYQTEYTFTTAYPPLLDEIRKLHSNVGNAETEGYEIVLGVGATGVMNSLMYALAVVEGNSTCKIFSQKPHYGNYVPQALNTYSPPGGFLDFDYDADVESEGTYEIVTYPNNPDGAMRKPIVADDSRVIYDTIYYWPQFTEITHKLDKDIMLFSASKHTGHAGSRLGWALVKDKDVADKMREFTEREIGVSVDSQIRYTYTLSFINEQFEEGTGSAFYDFGERVMTTRWEQTADLFRQDGQGQLGAVKDIKFANYEAGNRAYVWLEHADVNVDLTALLLKEALISGTGGVGYGVGANFCRIQMMARSVEIDDFVDRLGEFLQREDHKQLGELYEAGKWKDAKQKKSSGC